MHFKLKRRVKNPPLWLRKTAADPFAHSAMELQLMLRRQPGSHQSVRILDVKLRKMVTQFAWSPAMIIRKPKVHDLFRAENRMVRIVTDVRETPDGYEVKISTEQEFRHQLETKWITASEFEDLYLTEKLAPVGPGPLTSER